MTVDHDLYWRTTNAVASRVASSQGLPSRKLFDDSLRADVARVQVRRELMRRFPSLTPIQRDALIVELTEDYDV